MKKKTIKFITEPIWKPIVILGKELKKAMPDIPNIFMKALKDESGMDIWFAFVLFSIVVFFGILILASFTTSFSVIFTIFFCITFPVYVALYHARSYFKRQREEQDD